MLTFFAVLIRILVNPLSNVFQKRICAGGQSALVANFQTYLALSFLVLPLAWNISWATLPPAAWGYAALVGLFGGLGNGFLVKAVRSGELSVLGPINAWKSVVGIAFGIVLLHEIPGPVGLVGVALIVGGSYFVIGVNGGGERLSWRIFGRPDLRYRVAAMALAAIEAVFIKKVVLDSDPNTAFVLWCWGGTFFSLLLLPLLEKTDWRVEITTAKKHVAWYLGLVLSVGLMQWSTNYAFQRIPVGFALALFQLSSILSVFYGWWFFGETNIARKLLGSAVMVLGSVLIVLKL